MTERCAYERGVAALVAGDPRDAVRWLRTALSADPVSVLAYAALAVALSELAVDGEAADAIARAQRAGRLSRRDRHHVAVVALLLGGSSARGIVLAQEHVAEFPDDAVIRHLLARGGAG